MARAKRELDSELNLISFVSLLSVLICSLLLTAIWIHIGSMDVKQAVGGQAAGPTTDEKTPSLWTNLASDGSVKFILQDFPKKARGMHNRRIEGVEGKVDAKAVREYVEQLKGLVPSLRTALVLPRSEVLYEEIINLMDDFKKQGLIDLGVVPL